MRCDACRVELYVVNERIVGRRSILVTGSCRFKYDPGSDGVANQRPHTYPEYTAIRRDVAGPELTNRLKVVDKEVIRAGSHSVVAELRIAERSSTAVAGTRAVCEGRI